MGQKTRKEETALATMNNMEGIIVPIDAQIEQIRSGEVVRKGQFAVDPLGNIRISVQIADTLFVNWLELRVKRMALTGLTGNRKALIERNQMYVLAVTNHWTEEDFLEYAEQEKGYNAETATGYWHELKGSLWNKFKMDVKRQNLGIGDRKVENANQEVTL